MEHAPDPAPAAPDAKMALAESEKLERPSRIARLTQEVEELFPLNETGGEALKAKITASFNVPQMGEYHNEGMFMDTHLDFIGKNLEDAANARFPQQIPSPVRTVLQTTALAYGATLRKYKHLHDVSKMDSLRITQNGEQRDIAWEEWQAMLPAGVQGNPVALLNFCSENNIVSISYYHQADGGKHGERGKKYLESIGYTGVPPTVLIAIDKHEVAYLFEAINPDTYKRHLAALSPEERDLALTASYIDTMSSLREDGQPDLSNFMALLNSRANYERIAEVESRLRPNKKLVKNKVAKAIASLYEAKELFTETLEEMVMRLEKKCGPNQYNPALLEVELAKLSIDDALKTQVLELVRTGKSAQLGQILKDKMSLVAPALEASVIKGDFL